MGIDKKQSSTPTLIVALHVLAQKTQSEDGPANAAIEEAGNRLSKLYLMVNHAYPIIKAQHGAEHMLDGFKPKKRDIDALLAEFEGECTDQRGE